MEVKCPITKEYMDCKTCPYVDKEKCPVWELDDYLSKALKFIREVIEKQNENS